MKVLLADRDPSLRRLMATLLLRKGIDCMTVDTGQDTVNSTETESFDLIFIDSGITDMNSYEATRVIREKETKTGEHVPIIALAEYDEEDEIQRCLDAGMDDYIAKPLHFERVFAVIARFCKY